MLWCVMCRMVYVYATLSSLALSSQPVCVWVGWHRCLTVCTYAHSTNYSITLIIIIITIIVHTIQYIYYNYTHTKYDSCLHYTVSCEEAMLYTSSCIYYTMLYYVYVCSTHCDIWLWIIISYTILIYYNTITIIITIILIYFYFYYCVVVCVVLVCVVLCYLSCVCMCALLCVLAYAHTCVSVCVYPASPSQTVLWWRG